MIREALVKNGERVTLFLIVATHTALLSGCVAKAPTTVASSEHVLETYRVETRYLSRDMDLPAEVLPYQEVPIYPKISGFIKWIGVDRGSIVKKGQLLVTLVAPELSAQKDEALAKKLETEEHLEEVQRRLQSERALQAQSQAKMESDKLTCDRLMKAAQTPGVVAQNELDVQQKLVEGDKQLVNSHAELVKAAEAQIMTSRARIKAATQAVTNVQDLKNYLSVTAPFDGVITERNMHEGSLAYPPSGANGYPPMLRINQNDLLRIVVPVPEIAVSDLRLGASIPFSVAAFPGRKFIGKVARLAHSLDVTTRTMPVELNYSNTEGLIAPGMFPEVHWPMKRAYSTLFVPTAAVALTLRQPFVIKASNGRAQWVNVKRGQVMGNMIEVFPTTSDTLSDKDEVVLNANDGIVDGSQCTAKRVGPDALNGVALPARGQPHPLIPAEEPGVN